MKIWKLKKGHDQRIRAQHPWVFSNELLDSPKSILPGEPVELHDFQSRFLARGYGNPHSLISFRAMSFSPKENFTMSAEDLTQRLLRAWKRRHSLGFRQSFRLCYSEADEMPGLILDRYVITSHSKEYQVFSYQLLTSGMDRAFKKDQDWNRILSRLVELSQEQGLSLFNWDQSIILQRNDVNIRKLEGLEVESPQILKTVDTEDLTDVHIQIPMVLMPEKNILFNVNLPEGQKTGFFLDQTWNIQLLLRALETQKSRFAGQTVKILDLCCYMGQWSAQIAAQLQAWGISCEVHLVDVSELALEKAQKNVSALGAAVKTYKKDVLSLDELTEVQALKFDVIISDPPAFVKNKKDIHQGLHAYTKLNTQAFKLAAPQAFVVSCTCSGAVQFEEFREALQKSLLKSGVRAKCLAVGGQGWDHPYSLNFPEGYYLKMLMHQTEMQKEVTSVS